MKILITGTAGFIGFHLAKKLITEGYDIVGIDNINDYYDVNIKYGRLSELGINKTNIKYNNKIVSSKHTNFKFIKLDITDKENINIVFSKEKFDIVCNLAAQAGVRCSMTNPEAYISSNISGFFTILESCKNFNIKHLVYASSSSVYGLNKSMPFSCEHGTDHQISLYGVSKRTNELMSHSYSHLYGTPTTGLRFFTVYGPWGRPDMALFLFTDAIYNNKAIDVYNYGNMQRDFTYIDDIVKGISKVLRKPALPDKNWNPKNPSPDSSTAPFKIYNIGNNNPVMLMDFINEIENKIGKKAIKNMLPIQAGDVQKTYADVDNLVEDFAYKPNTSIKTGISNFIDWYTEFYKINK